MGERVTVAVDGGPASSAALAWVIDRARTVEMAIELTTIINAESERQPDGQPGSSVQRTTALEEATELLRAALPRVAVTPRARWGSPNEAVLDASRRSDLVVIGTHGTTTVAGVTHATLPLKIAGRSACTTVVVPVGWKPQSGPVVVGWADDPTSDTALAFGAREAERRGVPLTIVHGWTAPAAATVNYFSSAVAIEGLESTNRDQLQQAAAGIRLAFPSVAVTEELEPGPAAAALLHDATGASLVVVGSRGRGPLAGLLLGSVSHSVLLAMPAPVAVVPRHGAIDVYPEVLEEDLV